METYRATENLIREAFWNVYRPGCSEHYVMHVLRDDPAFIPELDFVMEQGGKLIGQNVFMKTVIEAEDGRIIPVLTVFFEDPFWVGVFERVDDGKLSECKVTFGAETKDYDVWEFVLRHYKELTFSPAVETETRQTADNPKRRLRNARKQTERSGIGTKSQQALQLQREEMKTERLQFSWEQMDAAAQRCFEMKQLKKKGKRRGHGEQLGR